MYILPSLLSIPSRQYELAFTPILSATHISSRPPLPQNLAKNSLSKVSLIPRTYLPMYFRVRFFFSEAMQRIALESTGLPTPNVVLAQESEKSHSFGAALFSLFFVSPFLCLFSFSFSPFFCYPHHCFLICLFSLSVILHTFDVIHHRLFCL